MAHTWYITNKPNNNMGTTARASSCCSHHSILQNLQKDIAYSINYQNIIASKQIHSYIYASLPSRKISPPRWPPNHSTSPPSNSPPANPSSPTPTPSPSSCSPPSTTPACPSSTTPKSTSFSATTPSPFSETRAWTPCYVAGGGTQMLSG